VQEPQALEQRRVVSVSIRARLICHRKSNHRFAERLFSPGARIGSPPSTFSIETDRKYSTAMAPSTGKSSSS